MENPIFLVGLRRSGSTLWGNIIDANPQIYRMGEMHFLTPWDKDFRYFIRKKVGHLSDEKNIEKMIELIFSRERVRGITGPFWHSGIERVNNPDLKKKLYHRLLESDKSLESIFKILIEEITNFSGYDRCYVKFPVYVNYVPRLLQWYPGCRIIHVTRDPRAIAMSKTNDPGGTSIKIKRHPRMSSIIRKIMILFVIVQYIWTSKLHCKYKGIENYALFRYEDLLADPEGVIEELCEFTGMDFVPEMREPKEAQASSLTGKKRRGFDKKAASRWMTAISPFEKMVISWLTKGSMKRFEYDPENHPVYLNG